MHSLPGGEDFARVLRHGAIAAGRKFRVHALRSERSGARLGVIVPKRIARKAVCRNAYKRHIREFCRALLEVLDGWDLVVRVERGGMPLCVNEAREELAQQLKAMLCVENPGRPD